MTAYVLPLDEVPGKPMHTHRQMFEAIEANIDLMNEWETDMFGKQWTFFRMRSYLSEKQFDILVMLYNRMITRQWARSSNGGSRVLSDKDGPEVLRSGCPPDS